MTPKEIERAEEVLEDWKFQLKGPYGHVFQKKPEAYRAVIPFIELALLLEKSGLAEAAIRVSKMENWRKEK